MHITQHTPARAARLAGCTHGSTDMDVSRIMIIIYQDSGSSGTVDYKHNGGAKHPGKFSAVAMATSIAAVTLEDRQP